MIGTLILSCQKWFICNIAVEHFGMNEEEDCGFSYYLRAGTEYSIPIGRKIVDTIFKGKIKDYTPGDGGGNITKYTQSIRFVTKRIPER